MSCKEHRTLEKTVPPPDIEPAFRHGLRASGLFEKHFRLTRSPRRRRIGVQPISETRIARQLRLIGCTPIRLRSLAAGQTRCHKNAVALVY